MFGITPTNTLASNYAFSFYCAEPPGGQGDFLLLAGRVLMFDIKNLLNNEERNQVARFLMGRLPKKGVSVERKGGSNGTFDNVDPEMVRRLFHLPGSCPRASRGAVWIPQGLLHCFYMNCYEAKLQVEHYEYAMPASAGQLELSVGMMEKGAPEVLFDLLRVQVESKLIVGAFIAALNTRIQAGGFGSLLSNTTTKVLQVMSRTALDRNRNRCIVQEAVAVQEATNERIRKQHKPEDHAVMVLHHATTTKLSVIATALHTHIDRTRKHVDHPKATSFFETKILLTVPDHAGDLERYPDLPALGRGGAGRGQFVIGCKYKYCSVQVCLGSKYISLTVFCFLPRRCSD